MIAVIKSCNKFPALLIHLVISTISAPVFAQNTSTTAKDSLEDDQVEIFDRVEIEASYPGGETAWRRFLEQNLNAAVPANKKAPVGVYTVVVQFVVDKEGKISAIKPLTAYGYGMEEEVVRILRKAPRWNPAIQDGRQVKAYRKQPVTFMVMEEEKKKKKNRD